MSLFFTFVKRSLPLLLALTLAKSPIASADSGTSFREYEVTIKVANGEIKKTLLKVNLEIQVNRFGDPEIPDHGFYDFNVTGSAFEGQGAGRPFELLLAQGNELLRTEELVARSYDRSGEILLPSGLVLSIPSVRALLTGNHSTGSLRVKGLSRAIGEGEIHFSGIRTVPEEPIFDPCH